MTNDNKSLSEIRKQLVAETEYRPTAHQQRVKARIHRLIDERSHIIDRDQLFGNTELLVEFAGTSKILEWLGHPGFVAWIYDDHMVVDEIFSMRDQAVRAINEILTDPDVEPKDRLKAANMVLELTDMFPGKRNEVRFLDERLNSLSSNETDREIQRLTGQLAKLPGDVK